MKKPLFTRMGILALALLLYHGVLCRADASNIVAWGAGATNTGTSPNYGQSIVPTSLSVVTQVAGGGYHSLALQSNGTMTAWGLNNYAQTFAPASKAIGIAAGFYHCLGLQTNGVVEGWGLDAYNQTSVPVSATNVTAIAAGWYHSMALKSNGTVLAWGAGTTVSSSPILGQSIVPTNLAGVIAIAGGGYHSLALLANGTVVAWGWNASGQTNVPASLTNVVSIAAGGSNSLALKLDGTLVAWGDNTYGQNNIPPGLSNVVAISAGAAHCMALKQDGTLVAWGLNTNGQATIPNGLTNVTAISAGAYHSLAVLNVGPVTFMQPLPSQTIFKGSNSTLNAYFLGAQPLTCQWLVNGTNILNATNSSLSITNAPLAASGNYQIVVSNAYGAMTSSVAVLTVNDTAPFFTVQPTNISLLPGSNVTFSASVGGLPPFTYQWYFNGSQVSGATNTSLTLTNVQMTNAGNYSLVAANALGTNSSSNAFLTVVGIAQALGPTNLTWSNPSQPAWYVETTNTLDGFAVGVGPLANGQQSILQTTVSGPGTLTFYWKDQSLLALSFLVDGTNMASIQYGANAWSSNGFYLSSGVHVLTWTCINNSYPNSTGFAALDEMTYTSGGTAAFITSQPISHTNYAGTNVTFSVGELGTPPFSNLWYFNNAPLPGATGASFTLNNIQSSNAGVYNVVVSNGYGTAISSNASLVVLPTPPVFTTQPVNTESILGGQASFNVSAAGSTPISYQWYSNGGPIAGATATSITITNVQYANGGTYYLVASNAAASVASSNATLLAYGVSDLAAAMDNTNLTWGTTNVPWFPETNITHSGVSAAQSGVISGSQQSTLQASVTGPATLTYWWQVSCDSFWDSLAFSINGANQNSIAGTVSWQQVTNYIPAGTNMLTWNLYPVHEAFAGGTGWVDQVQVSFGGTAPFITANPASSTNSAGGTATFSATALGTPPFFYQWQFNGTNLSDATDSTLSLANVQSNNAGIYSAVISNAFGFAVTSNANLVVNPSGPTITQQPTSQTAVFDSAVTFITTTQGSAPISYLWQFNGNPLPGATSSSLTVTNVQSANAGAYQVVITNNYGSITSSVALLDIGTTIVIDVSGPDSGTPSFSTVFGMTNITAVAAGASHTLGLCPDGTVLAWGNNSYGQTNVPAGLSNVVAVAAGATHSLALKSDGTVVAWGDNSYGQLLVPSGLSNVTRLATSSYYTLALKNDGTIVGWGNNSSGQLNIPAGLTNVQDIAAGYYNGFALNYNGTVSIWGNGPIWQSNGSNTQLNIAPGLSNFVQVVAGGYTAWTLDSSGLVRSWGFDLGQFGVASALAANGANPSDDYVLLLGNSGQVFTLAPYFYNTSISNVVAMSAGPGHAVLLVNDGAPVVVRQLFDQTVYTGSSVVLFPGLAGAPPLNFQWLFNGTNLPGATNGYLYMTNISFANAGSYACSVSNAYGTATTLPAMLTVLRSTPSFNASGGGLQLSTNGFSLQLNGLSGHGNIILYFSTDLQNWTPILTNSPTVGSLQLTDGNATNFQKGFYRAVEQ